MTQPCLQSQRKYKAESCSKDAVRHYTTRMTCVFLQYFVQNFRLAAGTRDIWDSKLVTCCEIGARRACSFGRDYFSASRESAEHLKNKKRQRKKGVQRRKKILVSKDRIALKKRKRTTNWNDFHRQWPGLQLTSDRGMETVQKIKASRYLSFRYR